MPCAASTSRTAASHASRRAGHLVGEVDVAGGVDHVEDVHPGLGALGVVRRDGPREAHGLALDRDAALALDVHPVEVLRARRALVDDAGELEHAVGQRRLAVVDVRDDAEVADDRRVGRARLRRVLEAHGLLSAATSAGSGHSSTRVVPHRTGDGARVPRHGRTLACAVTSRTGSTLPLVPAAAFVLVWSSGYISGPAAVHAAAPFSVLGWRFVIAALLGAGLALALRRPTRMDRATLGRVAAVGLVMNALQFGLMYVAFDLGLGATLASLFHALSPVLTALLAAALLGERVVDAAGRSASSWASRACCSCSAPTSATPAARSPCSSAASACSPSASARSASGGSARSPTCCGRPPCSSRCPRRPCWCSAGSPRACGR